MSRTFFSSVSFLSKCPQEPIASSAVSVNQCVVITRRQIIDKAITFKDFFILYRDLGHTYYMIKKYTATETEKILIEINNKAPTRPRYKTCLKSDTTDVMWRHKVSAQLSLTVHSWPWTQIHLLGSSTWSYWLVSMNRWGLLSCHKSVPELPLCPKRAQDRTSPSEHAQTGPLGKLMVE